METVILTAHQPTYLPWLGLFDKIAQADEFCLFDVCPMEDSGFENRNKILTQNGEQWLTVPVRRVREAPLSELRIASGHPWARKHWRSIELAYHKAPFWDLYGPELKPFYENIEYELLVTLDHALLLWFMNALGLKRPTRVASKIPGGLSGTKSALVLSMCKALGASEYIFGQQGRDYVDLNAFQAAGIGVRFQAYRHPTYPQLKPGFTSHMSVLDLIMNVGPDSLQVLTGGAK